MASLAAHLRARGHEVEVGVDTRRPGDLRERLGQLGFRIREDLSLTTKGFPPSLLGDARTLRRIGAGFDVVHANFSNDHAAALLGLRARGERPRVVRTVHSARSLEARPLQGAAHRRTDGLVTICEAHAHTLRERFGVPEERILATRGAVDTDRFRPEGPDLRAELGIDRDAPVAGIISRIKPDRRHGELVEAFARVVRRIPAARLVVVGRGEELPALRARAAERGLERAVVFAGYRSGAELAAAYRTLDVKVLLAEGNDGSCRALLEAMACGRAAVAYDFGAPREAIVAGETGTLVPVGDVEALAGALADLLGDPATCRTMGAAGRERVRGSFREEQRAEAIERFFVTLLGMPPAVL
jgi:glycosyltransferase involved in cell wall biosynthesis